MDRVERPTMAFYRKLYSDIGGHITWTARKLMGDEELQANIHHPKVEIFVLYVNDEPAGYVELDFRKPPDVELLYFGLTPAFYGKGLGNYMLKWAIHYVWKEKNPKRFWLHTCTLDHPKALPLYFRCGFEKFKETIDSVDEVEEI